MSEASISLVVGGEKDYKHKHNRRIGTGGAKHVDKDRSHLNVYAQKTCTPEEGYEHVFGDAIRKYNNKQKRKDRKITNYYEQMKENKRVESVREMIVAIGEYDDNIPVETKKEILLEYMKNFGSRNPNLFRIDCVLHMDEANPHLHVDYIPFYDTPNAKRGLERTLSFEGAVKQQGCNSFKEWRDKEVDEITHIMRSKGLSRKLVGSHQGVHHSVYKERKEEEKKLQTVIAKRDKLHGECFELEREIYKLKEQRSYEIKAIDDKRNEDINKCNEIINNYRIINQELNGLVDDDKLSDRGKRIKTTLAKCEELNRKVEQAKRELEQSTFNSLSNDNGYTR